MVGEGGKCGMKSIEKNKKVDYQNVSFNYNLIKKSFDEIIRENGIWDRFFSGFGITPVELVYEDIVHDRSYVHDIAELMGVGNVQVMPRTLHKLGGEVNSEWRITFEKMSLEDSEFDKKKKL